MVSFTKGCYLFLAQLVNSLDSLSFTHYSDSGNTIRHEWLPYVCIQIPVNVD